MKLERGRPERMVLSLFMKPQGYHTDAWRLPESESDRVGELDYLVELARRAEAAKLHSIFLADQLTAGSVPGADPTPAGAYYEPIGTLGALAAVTERIGLIGTASTTFTEPFNLARQLTNLDRLSGGRIGWNIVTSYQGGENFGYDQLPSPAERYRRAREFLQVAIGLWNSWSDSAVLVDRDGVWARPEKIRAIEHVGEFFSVRGPSSSPRSAQGHPILVQAGQSPDGMDFGATFAEFVYTAQPEKALAVDFYRRFKALTESKGRRRDDALILPGLVPIVAATDAEAKELAEHLGRHVDLEAGRDRLAGGNLAGIKFGDLSLDDAIPAERFTLDPGRGSRYHLFRHFTVDEGMTIRDLIMISARSMGHLSIVGSPATIADQMIDWFESRAADGFSLNPPYMPGGLNAICELLVPELQERGYFREEYESGTLRQQLGFARPAAWDREESAAR